MFQSSENRSFGSNLLHSNSCSPVDKSGHRECGDRVDNRVSMTFLEISEVEPEKRVNTKNSTYSKPLIGFPALFKVEEKSLYNNYTEL
jgi:hypothetical protein